MKRAVVVLTLAALTTACIVKRTTHTLYLESDGSVTWAALEQDVHSDCQDLAECAGEEQGFLDALAAGEHPLALALRDLGGSDVSAVLLRGRRPFEVRASARFQSLEVLARALLEGFGIPGTAALGVNDGVWTLRIVVRVDEISEGDDDQGLTALVEDADAYRLIASSARFVDARGFDIEDDGRSVRLDLPADDEVAERGGELELSLSWVEGQ